MIWHKKSQRNRISHAKSRGFSWLVYLILICCSLSSVTLSRYTKTISGTAEGKIARPVCVVQGVGESSTQKNTIVFKETVSSLADGGYCIFKVMNYDDKGITEVRMDYEIALTLDSSDYTLYQVDGDGNLQSPSAPQSLSVGAKQCDTYVIQLKNLSTSEFEVTVTATQVIG